MSPRRWTQALVVAIAVPVVAWGWLRLWPQVRELRSARAEVTELADRPGATRDEVDALSRELAAERARASETDAASPSGSDLSRLAEAAGLVVDVSQVWEAPAEATQRRRSRKTPPTLAERVHAEQPERLIFTWRARGDYSSLLRFVDGLERVGHAAVLELNLERPRDLQAPLEIDLVITP